VQQLRQLKRLQTPVLDLLSLWRRFVPNARSDRQNRVLPEAGIGQRPSAQVERRAAGRGNPFDVPAHCAQPGPEPLSRHICVGFSVERAVHNPFYLDGIDV
jgi:hypothetical protein